MMWNIDHAFLGETGAETLKGKRNVPGKITETGLALTDRDLDSVCYSSYILIIFSFPYSFPYSFPGLRTDSPTA